MLTENEVVDFVCAQLEIDGFLVLQRLETNQIGIDIVAQSGAGIKCFVEAKGATSSKEGSSRYGKEFNKSQVKTHVGMALVAAFKVIQLHPEHLSIVAFPDNITHREIIESMYTPLKASGIKVWFVNKDTVDKFI